MCAVSKTPLMMAHATTVGTPFVMVPVLSKTMHFRLLDVSKASADLIRHPYRLAAIPVATLTAVGVASPIAQGQAIIMVDMANLSANII